MSGLDYASARFAPAREPVARLIELILAATPEPPSVSADADPDLLLGAAERMLAARAPHCAALAALPEDAQAIPEAAAAEYARLRERDLRWSASLDRARFVLAERMRAARHLRRRY